MIRILTYNVRYFSHATRGVASTTSNVARIAHALAALSPLPDVLCLQEVESHSIRSMWSKSPERPRQSQLDRFMQMFRGALRARRQDDAVEFRSRYFPAHDYRITQRQSFYTTGLAVITGPRVDVELDNADAPHDITHRPATLARGLKQTRICAHVRIKPHDTTVAPFDVFNTHLSLPNAFAADFWLREQRMGHGQNQLAEIDRLASYMAERTDTGRAVLLGDFNSVPGSPAYARIRERLGLRDPFAQSRGLSEADLAKIPTAGFMALRFRLDHVFASPSMQFASFEGTRPFGDVRSPFFGLSDHVPISATLQA